MKYIVCLIIGVSTLLGFGGCSDKCAKVPLVVPVDFSKKGTVYETDFQAPWNIWGSLVSFNLMINYFDELGYTNTDLNEEQWKIKGSIKFGSRDEKLIPKEQQQYFKLKVTLTPLGWASDDIEIKTIDYSKESWFKYTSQYEWIFKKDTWQKKEFKDGKKIEVTIQIPLYGGDNGEGGKTIMIADLQRLRNYHIRVESLEDIELPKGVQIKFEINRNSAKH